MQLRQGRSLWLPTLPYQRTNPYAVVGAKPTFVLLHPHIGYTNSYAVDGVMSAFVLLRHRIGYTNRYAVVGAMPVFVLLYPHIGYTNSYAVDGAKLVSYLLRPRISHTNGYAVVGTTPLICAWAVMKCLLSRTIYIIRCIAVSNEMGFIGKIHQPSKLTNSQRISLPSPLGEGLGVRLFFPLLRQHHHFNPIPLQH